MQIEIHGMLYMYDTTDIDIANTAFLSYELINRNVEDISNFKMGLWTDFDLGNPQDDYMGCDSSKNIVFCYNADVDDDGGFGLYPPATGFAFLSEPMYGSINYLNALGGGVSPNVTDPSTALQYSNYMDQLWKNGSPLVLELPNGDGYSTSGGYPQTHFQYNAAASWSQFGGIGDSRNMSSTASHYLSAGESRCFEIAFSAAREIDSTDIFASLNKLIGRLDAVRGFYNGMGIRCLESNVSILESEQVIVQVYPNPATTELHIVYNNDTELLEVHILDINGRLLRSYTSGFETLDISELKTGVYMLQLRTAKQDIHVHRFIKG